MYIYKTTNKINGKFYVGKSKYRPDENPQYLGSGYILKKAINKYGAEAFEKEILEECDHIDDLNEAEKKWIKSLDANNRDVGYNISSGGDWGDTWTNHPRREELCEGARKRAKGKRNPNYGNYWTDEQKKHMSEVAIRNKQWIDKKTGLNIAQSPEARKKISDTKMAMKNPNGCKWKLIDPEGNETTIYGGIKRKIKRFGLDYQQFHVKDPNDPNIRRNLYGWTLIKIPKENT